MEYELRTASIRRNTKSHHFPSSSNFNLSNRSQNFSTSNLSSISHASSVPNIGKRSLRLSLPLKFGAKINSCGKVIDLEPNGPCHQSGLVQIGDFFRVLTGPDDKNRITVQVTYGILTAEERPQCPFMIEIGNRSSTSLGIALTDTPSSQIAISSIQRGSLADRCGFLKPGDVITCIHIKSESIPCSPYYTSYQVAQILRKCMSEETAIRLTILPKNLVRLREIEREVSNSRCSSSHSTNSTILANSESDRDEGEGGKCILTFCLWKDRLYEDWGFSLMDDENNENNNPEPENQNESKGAIVNEIRTGGPAFLAGLKQNDRIIRINERDVSFLESTILVPILASLDDVLNIVIVRDR